MKTALVVFLGVGLISGLLAAVNATRDAAGLDLDWRLTPTVARLVDSETPAKGTISQTITAPGAIEAIGEAEIASQVVGRVVEVTVHEGDTVKAGQLLVRLDPIEAQARLDSAHARIDRLRASLSQVEADMAKATRDAARSGQLSVRGAASATEVADAATALARSRAGLLMVKQELAEAEALQRTSEQDLSRTQILAPIDGVVSGLTVEVGEVAIPGTPNLPGALLMTVTDLANLRVRVQVDETDVLLVQGGQYAFVYPQADQRTPVLGKVDRVSAKGKKLPGGEVVSFETFVTLDPGPSKLRPGMTTTAIIEVKRATDVTSVPVQAVVHRRRKDLPDSPEVRAWVEKYASAASERPEEAARRYLPIVFLEKNGVAIARPVVTGLSDSRRIEIKEGLESDDLVITGPFRSLDELKDGMPITHDPALAAR